MKKIKSPAEKELTLYEPEVFSMKSATGHWKVFLSITQGPLATAETEDQAWEKALAKYHINHPKLKS